MRAATVGMSASANKTCAVIPEQLQTMAKPHSFNIMIVPTQALNISPGTGGRIAMGTDAFSPIRPL